MTKMMLRDVRTQRGYTQVKMAQLLDVAYTTYTQWESGKRKINERSKVAILTALNCKAKDVSFPEAHDPRTPRKIQLINGGYATVDADDFDYLEQWDWIFHGGYAVRLVGPRDNRKYVFMHREILKTPDDKISDHINGKTLDNRKKNLRVVDSAQNCQNRAPNMGCKSKYKGVSVYKNRYGARIKVNGVIRWLGLFENEVDAAEAYNKAALEAWGEFARLNKIKSPTFATP